MSWDRNSIKARHIGAAFLLLSASAAAADILVIRSIGPSAKAYPPGKKLPEAGKVTLKASDQLVLIDSRGTRTLRGPGSFALNAAPQRAAGGTGAPAPRARIGATRGPQQPTYWDIDVAKSATFCVADRNDLLLWREDSSGPVILTVTRARDRQVRKVAWQAGAATLKWPAQLPIAEGAEFRLAWDGAPAPTVLRFRILPKKPLELDAVAATLLARGCTAQLDRLIQREQKNETGGSGD